MYLYMTSVPIHQRIGTQIFFHWTPTKYSNEQDFSICMYVCICILSILTSLYDVFSQNPSKFVPQFGGFCSWGVAAEFCPSYPWVRAYVLYVCMESIVQYLCMYNLLYVCTYVYLCLRLFSFLFVAKHYVCMYVCMSVCIYVCMNVCSPRTVWVQREAGRSGRSRTRSSTSST